MAKIENLIPHIIKWECGVTAKPGESNMALFERARKKGFANIPGDSGGATMIGVTIGTFKDWCKQKGRRTPSINDLKAISYFEWLAILKTVFWDPCNADGINNQSIANMLVDWRWVNGKQAVRDTQICFSLVADGIVGPKTLAALNGSSASTIFNRLKYAREAAYKKIVKNRPSQQKFLSGWINRTNDIKFF